MTSTTPNYFPKDSISRGLPGGPVVKNLLYNAGDFRFDPWSRNCRATKLILLN